MLKSLLFCLMITVIEVCVLSGSMNQLKKCHYCHRNCPWHSDVSWGSKKCRNKLIFITFLIWFWFRRFIKQIVHFKINCWYVLAYLKGIQDVDVFVSGVVSILIFLGQTILVYQSYNAGLWSPPQKACGFCHRDKWFLWEDEQYLYRFYLL